MSTVRTMVKTKNYSGREEPKLSEKSVPVVTIQQESLKNPRSAVKSPDTFSKVSMMMKTDNKNTKKKKIDMLCDRDVRAGTPAAMSVRNSQMSCVITQSVSSAATPICKIDEMESTSTLAKKKNNDIREAQSIQARLKKKLKRTATAAVTGGTTTGTTIEMTAPAPSIERVDFIDLINRHYKKLSSGVAKIRYLPHEFDAIIRDANEVFVNERALLDIDPPCVVVGDLHGQFNDLLNMFILNGRPPNTVYVFTGDYVDRGMMSIECIMLLLAYKITYPSSFFLLRGNHEIARVNMKYGFYDECVTSIPDRGEEVWAQFQRCFNNLPIAALIATKILCMHGGLSPSLITLNDLRFHPKPIRNPYRGIVNDMLWADPDLAVFEWKTSTRGSGFAFGTNIIDEVCERLGVELIIRAHQMCFDGYWAISNRRMITIFSAPVYCNLYKNAGCVLKISESLCVQLVAFVPESPNLERTIREKNRLWDVGFDQLE